MSYNNSPSAYDTPNHRPPGSAAQPDVANPWTPQVQYHGPVAMMRPGLMQQLSPYDKIFIINQSPARIDWKDMPSPYRAGQVVVGPNGVNIIGKAAPSGWKSFLFYFIGNFTIGWLFSYLLIEYALREDSAHFLPWNCVDAVAYDQVRGRVCIKYHLPEKPQTTYSLGLWLDNVGLEALVRQVGQYAPETVSESKIRSGVSYWLLGTLLAYLLLFVVIGFIIFA